MSEQPDVRMLQVREVACKLFGDHSDASRKRVRALIKNGTLKGRRLGDKRGSPHWITKKNFDQFIAELEGE